MMTLDALETSLHAAPQPELMAWSRCLAVCKKTPAQGADCTFEQDGEGDVDDAIEQYRAWAQALASHQRLRARLARNMAGADALTQSTLRAMAKGRHEPC